MLRLSTEVDSLDPFPCFDTTKEQDALDEDYTPLPADPFVLENDTVDDWDVESGENRDKPSDNGPEKELVLPDIVHPLRQIPAALRLHAEERAAHANRLPRQKKGKPCQADERCSASAEYSVAFLAIAVVTFGAKIPVTEAKKND